MKKEIALASALLFGGASQASAQEGSNPPVVEAEQIDVGAFIDAFEERVNFDVEPRFFKQLQRRAENNPNKYFVRQDISEYEQRYFYYPEGVESLRPKAGYIKSVGFLVGNMDNGVPATIPFVVETQDWYLDLGEDGTLTDPNGVDLFNYEDIEAYTQNAFKEPKVLKDVEWTRVPFLGSPASAQKLYTEQEELIEGFPSLSKGWLMEGNQSGLLHLSSYERTIE